MALGSSGDPGDRDLIYCMPYATGRTIVTLQATVLIDAAGRVRNSPYRWGAVQFIWRRQSPHNLSKSASRLVIPSLREALVLRVGQCHPSIVPAVAHVAHLAGTAGVHKRV